ncbi:MAG: acetyl-CoA acetyltransferase [Albimonas sp.]|uniref:acetyl-CoA acetyltransferase n=1 Tax=Albimonas sp. TaxID=1872425 RepID=UPI0040568FFD
MSGLRGNCAIVGVATFGIGETPGFDAMEAQAIAAALALEDAGLDKSRVDGLFGAMQSEFLNTLAFSEYFGIAPTFSSNNRIGGSSFLAHVQEAMAAIEAGLCSVALVTYGSVQRSLMGKLQTAVSAAWTRHETDYGPRFPVSSYALMARRHMHEFGTTREQLAHVAVSARGWAQMNPEAFARDPLSVEDVVNARPVSTPFGTLDCCLVTDGSGALVIARADIARDLKRPPVYVLGAGVAHRAKHVLGMESLTTTTAVESAARAYEMARVDVADIQMLQVYDAFTINTILLLEDLGFVEKGAGGPFVAEGRIAPGGDLPANTNGGGLSCCHPGMYGLFTLIEGARQLRGECGERQVLGLETALCHGVGGSFSSNATCILGTAATL